MYNFLKFFFPFSSLIPFNSWVSRICHIRDSWPDHILSSSSQALEVRDAYMARRTALQQFKFVDPFVADFYTVPQPYSHVVMDKNDVVFSQVLSIPVYLASLIWIKFLFTNKKRYWIVPLFHFYSFFLWVLLGKGTGRGGKMSIYQILWHPCWHWLWIPLNRAQW